MAAMRHEIEQLDPNRLLNTSPSDLAKYLVEKYTLQAPSLRCDDWSATETELQIDVRHDQNRWIRDRSRPCYVPGQRIEVEVPIEGEVELMYARASMFSSSPPHGEIRGRSLFLTYQVPHDSQGRNIRQEIDRTLAEINQHLGWIKNDLNGFNQGLHNSAEQTIASRRERILANQGRVASLGIPLKSRSDAPRTPAPITCSGRTPGRLAGATRSRFAGKPSPSHPWLGRSTLSASHPRIRT